MVLMSSIILWWGERAQARYRQLKNAKQRRMCRSRKGNRRGVKSPLPRASASNVAHLRGLKGEGVSSVLNKGLIATVGSQAAESTSSATAPKKCQYVSGGWCGPRSVYMNVCVT